MANDLNQRVVCLIRNPRNADTAAAILDDAGVAYGTYSNIGDLCREISRGAAAVVLTEEDLSDFSIDALDAVLARQPSWSELPIVVLLPPGSEIHARRALQLRGDVTLLERPVRVHVLLSHILSALKARNRQYLVRDYIAELERLNHELAERERELQAANEELQAFNYTVAHDLRKPLTIINGNCQAIQRMCSDRLDETCMEFVADAYKGTLRMNRLIDALLNFSRMAHVELKRQLVDLSSLALEVAEELKKAEPGRRVEFIVPKGMMVDADPGLLRVVLDNLLENAWKYTGLREKGIIELGMTETEGKATYFVRDNGTGFANEEAGKLFTPFQRLHGAEKFRGFGIGLATVERIIKRHGGAIWAEGEPGKGATFRFTLAGDEPKGGGSVS